VPLGAVSNLFHQPADRHRHLEHVTLIAAAAMLVQIPYTLDEVVAAGKYLWQKLRGSKRVLRILLIGGSDDVRPERTGTRSIGYLARSCATWWRAGRATVDPPGLEGDRRLADVHPVHLRRRRWHDPLRPTWSALVLSFSMIATAEVARAARHLNAPPAPRC
jgi:hypothetical protein